MAMHEARMFSLNIEELLNSILFFHAYFLNWKLDLLLSLLLKYQDAPKRPWMIQHVFNVYFPQFQKPDVYGNIIMVMGCQIRSTMHEK